MKTLWLRSLLRRYGNLGVLLVGAYLTAHFLWRRKHVAIPALLGLAIGFLWVINRACPKSLLHRNTEMITEPSYTQPSYAVTDLGTLGGKYSGASAINAGGEIVGISYTAGDKHVRAFLWKNGAMRDLGSLGNSNSRGSSINDRGQVVGESVMEHNRSHACLWEDGRMRDLGTLPDGVRSWACAINDKGDVVGMVLFNHQGARPFLFVKGKMQDLGTFPGRKFCGAISINNKGQVVGSGDWGSHFSAIIQHGFVWDRQHGLQDIGALHDPDRPYDYSFAAAINDNGEIVGESNRSAFLYSGGKMRSLGAVPGYRWSRANAINTQGQIVGRATEPGDGCAFVYRDGKMIDLNTLIPPNSGWKLTAAYGINDAGQIVGHGKINSQSHGFLLTPVRR